MAVDEPWDEIGKRLSAAREASEWTVDDVVFKTRIPRSVIEALEAENFSVFTSPTYAKSFLKQYSEYLNVDADLWLGALEPASYVSGESWQPMFATREAAPPAVRGTQRPAKETYANPAGRFSSIWLMILSAALVLAVVGGYRKFDEQFGQDPAPVKAKIEPQASQKPALKEEVHPAPPQVQVEPKSPQPQDEAPSASTPRAIIVRD